MSVEWVNYIQQLCNYSLSFLAAAVAPNPATGGLRKRCNLPQRFGRSSAVKAFLVHFSPGNASGSDDLGSFSATDLKVIFLLTIYEMNNLIFLVFVLYSKIVPSNTVR